MLRSVLAEWCSREISVQLRWGFFSFGVLILDPEPSFRPLIRLSLLTDSFPMDSSLSMYAGCDTSDYYALYALKTQARALRFTAHPLT